jgi:ribonuclease P protein component
MTLFLFPNSLGHGRLGVAATRKIGGAVSRNRAKRRMREIFRTSSIPAGLDLVVVARRELIDAPWPAVEGEFRALLGRLRRSDRT